MRVKKSMQLDCEVDLFHGDGHNDRGKVMEYADDDPWASRTPLEEKESVLAESPESIGAALPASSSTGSIIRKDADSDDDNDNDKDNQQLDDSEAWNADSDGEAGNEDAFVEATSRMSLNGSLVAEEQDLQESISGFGSSQAIAGPSTLSSAFDISATSSAPPLDDFDEDDDDGFGDFGEPAEGGIPNDDDDDFGAFDEAGAQVEDASFGFEGDENPNVQAGPSSSSMPANPPPPSETDVDDFGPPSNIDFESIWQDKEALTSAILGHFHKVYPNLYDGLDTSPARREAWNKIDTTLDPEEIILRNNPGAKRILEEYTNPNTFPYKPWEWKRSHIRIQAMREQGIPVNLDDVCHWPPVPRVLPAQWTDLLLLTLLVRPTN